MTEPSENAILTDHPCEFRHSNPLSLGVELELQVIDMGDYDLSASAADLIAYYERFPIRATISPELSSSMIEVSVGVFDSWHDVLERLTTVRDTIVSRAKWLNLGLCGGGSHPFQRWQQRRIFDSARFREVSSLYGYLAKQFTVFGQHIHVGCADGDIALWLLHSLNRFIPHFIALAASSPFFQASSTSFHSSRLNSVSAFPLSGRAPYFTEWKSFDENYFQPLRRTGIVKCMKDFYWDIRPKPEYGTIELRVCDTPLTMQRAALLAGYLQAICSRLIEQGQNVAESEYLVYSFNRFQACRFGLDGTYLDPISHTECTIRQSILNTIDWIGHSKHSSLSLGSLLIQLSHMATTKNDAERLMEHYAQSGTLEDVVQYSIDRFAG